MHDGAIHAVANTLLKFVGISAFVTNTAPNGGGAISTHDSVIITGTISFISNSAMQGGAIAAYYNSKLNLIETLTLLTMDMIISMQRME